MIIMRQEDFDIALGAIPGGDDGEVIFQFEVAERTTWPEFQRYLRAAPLDDMPYDIVSNNCLHKARKVMNWMCAEYSRKNPGKPPRAWGLITGDVPCDGDNRIDDWHALIFCFCDEGIYLGGAQDREVMQQSRVQDIKSVEYLIVGGG